MTSMSGWRTPEVVGQRTASWRSRRRRRRRRRAAARPPGGRGPASGSTREPPAMGPCCHRRFPVRGCASLVGVRIDFRGSPEPTLGVEWELALVDKAHPRPARTRAADLFAAGPRPAARTRAGCTRSCSRNTVEVVTGVCDTVAEAMADLRGTLEVVVPVGRRRSGSTCSAAAPTRSRRWTGQQLTEGHRYEELINRTQWWGRQMLIWGVHVHVGLPERDRVMPVLSVAAQLLPAPAGALGVLADLGRRRHRLRLQPGADVPAAADRRAAVPVRDLGGVRGVRRRPADHRRHRRAHRDPLGRAPVAAPRHPREPGLRRRLDVRRSSPRWSR